MGTKVPLAVLAAQHAARAARNAAIAAGETYMQNPSEETWQAYENARIAYENVQRISEAAGLAAIAAAKGEA